MNNDFKNILRAFINNFKALKFYIHSVEEFLFSYQEKSNEKHGEELLAIMYADYIANASDNQHFLDFLTEQRNVSINALNNQLDIHDAKQMDEKLDDYFKNKIKKMIR